MTIYHGDNIDIMKKLIDEGFAESFDMIYFDGPFNSGRIFSMPIPGTSVELVNPWHELKSMQHYEKPELYLDDYKKRIELARELLSDSGVLVLQISQKEGHYLKVLLDSVFGRKNFICEMIWKIIDKPYAYRSQYGLSHESIFFYGKTENYTKQDCLLYPSIWDDVGFYEALGDEDTFYPSQKPQKLMRRILEMTTQTGSLVGDFYCGSGSMAFTAESMGRSWIASDTSVHAVEVTRCRLSTIGAQPIVLNTNETESDGERYWMVPLINENGFHDSQTVQIPLPTLVVNNEDFMLDHVDWRTWALYNVPHVKMLNGVHVFDWNIVQEQVDALLSLPKEMYVQEYHHETNRIRIKDIFGFCYQFKKSASLAR
jgi:DNA modification methylase